MIEEHGDTKVRSAPQETGKNNKKPIIPDFASYEQKLRIRNGSINHTQQEEKQQEPSKPGGLLKSIPIIGGLLANLVPKIKKDGPEMTKTYDKTKKIGSELKEGNVEQVVDKKRVK